MRELIERKNKMLRKASDELEKIDKYADLLKERTRLTERSEKLLIDLVIDAMHRSRNELSLDLYYESNKALPEAKKEEANDE